MNTSPGAAIALLVLTAAVAASHAPAALEPQISPTALLARAREAAGGDAAIRRLRTMALSGTSMAGFNAITAQPLNETHPFDIRVILPDYFVRIDYDPGALRRTGFALKAPIREYRATDSGTQVSSSPTPPGFADAQRAALARLMLGMIAETTRVLPLRVERAARAHTLAFTGPGTFRAELDLDHVSGVPLRVRYEDSVMYPAAALTAADRKAGRMPQFKHELTEVTISFEDRREISGLNLPTRIRRLAVGRRFEDMKIAETAVNPRMTPADFKR